jgi:uncharacterized membrane protein
MESITGFIQRDVHPFLTHFPIALLIVSVGADIAARWRGDLRLVGWVTLLLGTLLAIPSVVTGLVAHIPYEGGPLIEVIEVHQFLAFGTTALFLGLTAWRWQSRRRGGDAATGSLYPLVAIVGLALLFAVGWTGGGLVFTHGVGVAPVTP